MDAMSVRLARWKIVYAVWFLTMEIFGGIVEYAHSFLVSSSAHVSPFEIDCGRKPRCPLVLVSLVL